MENIKEELLHAGSTFDFASEKGIEKPHVRFQFYRDHWIFFISSSVITTCRYRYYVHIERKCACAMS